MPSIPLPDSPVNSTPLLPLSPPCLRRGTVKWFNDAKGYGFLTADNGDDVFVHYSFIEGEGFKTLREGDTVEYAAIATPKGQQATRVQKQRPG